MLIIFILSQVFFFILNLIKLTYYSGKVNGALEARMKYQADKKERVIKSYHILKDSYKGVDLSFVYIILFVCFDVLRKEFTLSWSFFVIWCEIFIVGSLVEKINFFLGKKSKIVIIIDKHIFLDVGLIYHWTTRSEANPVFIQIIVDRFFKIRSVNVIAYDYFTYCYLFRPRIKYFIVCASDIWLVTFW